MLVEPVDISDLYAVEIDFAEDLERANLFVVIAATGRYRHEPHESRPIGPAFVVSACCAVAAWFGPREVTPSSCDSQPAVSRSGSREQSAYDRPRDLAESRAWTPFARYRHSLWLLTRRDLRVRYSTSALGYVWSILDPLVMAGIYWFVFTQVFERTVGNEPYIVFLLSALLPWMWFNGAVSDSTRAFLREAKLIRSTKIPRTIWVNRIVLSKGIEFVAPLPVLALFAVVFRRAGALGAAATSRSRSCCRRCSPSASA